MNRSIFTASSLVVALFIGAAVAAPTAHATPGADCNPAASIGCDTGESCTGVNASGDGTCQPGSGSGGVTPTPGNNGNNGGVTPNPGNNGNTGTTLANPLQGGTNLQTFLQDILKFVVQIGAIIVVLMLVFVGYKFVAAQGDASELQDARRMLLWTVVGALILLGAQAIAIGLQATVNALSTGQ